MNETLGRILGTACDSGTGRARLLHAPRKSVAHLSRSDTREALVFTTPGHESLSPDDIGTGFSERQARECVGCHSVYTPTERLDPPPAFMGIGCESCHGPGKGHVAAMKAGTKGPLERFLGLKGLKGEELNEVCGRCHRTAASVPERGKSYTNRFQPYGLSLSRCFKESKGALSCATCHDPHENNSTDHQRYEAVCKSCHTAPKASVCPKNRSEKCVSCHMPSRSAMESSEAPVQMADHFIRIYPEKVKP